MEVPVASPYKDEDDNDVNELNEVKHVDINVAVAGCPNGQKKKSFCPGISPTCSKCVPTDVEVPVASPYKDEDDNDAKDAEVPVDVNVAGCPTGQTKKCPGISPACKCKPTDVEVPVASPY